MATRRSTTAAAEPRTGLTRRQVVIVVTSFVVLVAAWTGFRWLVRDRLGWSMWVVVVVLGVLTVTAAVVARRSTNPDRITVANAVYGGYFVATLFALADAIDRSEILVLWVCAAVLVGGRLAFRWLRRGR